MATAQLNHSPRCVPYRMIMLLGNLWPPEGSKLPRSVPASNWTAEKQNREGTIQNRKIYLFFDKTYNESKAKLKKHYQGKIIIPFFLLLYLYLVIAVRSPPHSHSSLLAHEWLCTCTWTCKWKWTFLRPGQSMNCEESWVVSRLRCWRDINLHGVYNCEKLREWASQRWRVGAKRVFLHSQGYPVRENCNLG